MNRMLFLKVNPSKFSIAATGAIPLPLNAISNTLNCLFANENDFWGKLANIMITFVYLLFPIKLTCFKTP